VSKYVEQGSLKKLVNAIEPLIWGPFVTGNFLTPLCFPAIVLVLGIAGPLGWLPADALSYERAHALATNPICVIGILALIPLALLAGSHHLRFGIIDLGSAENDGPVALLLYGLWQLGALATAIAILRIFLAGP
jgi:fumarate reductase subunit D